MREIYLVDSVRTGIAKAGKNSWFANLRADDMAGLVMNEVMRRTGLEDKKEELDGVIIGGTALVNDMASNIGRYSVIMAGFPYSVPGCTVDRFCSSGVQSIFNAIAEINTGWSDLILAGGVQHMTHVPMGFGNLHNPRLGEFTDENAKSMGWTAEMVARQYGISREEQDQMAFESHAKAHAATEAGLFKDEILPIEVDAPQKDGSTKQMIVDRDQGIRPGTTLESLAKMEPVFMKDELATVAAGKASHTNDAAAMVVVASGDRCKELGLKPKMKLVGYKAIGCDPVYMGIGPTLAIPAVLKQAGMTADQIDIWEINEAFASQAVYCTKELGIRNHPLLNPRGSGIALGHPLGCTGARIVTTLMREMPDYGAKYAMESMCVGHGQGVAAIWEWVG
ncbi:MAG: thiolase family protein [Syntrophomonadaceae bacterium]|nr:thiolase family protein [Syntrophomonadaceae bacterium]